MGLPKLLEAIHRARIQDFSAEQKNELKIAAAALLRDLETYGTQPRELSGWRSVASLFHDDLP